MNSQSEQWGVSPAQLASLADFFSAEDLEFRVGSVSKEKRRGMALVYVTNRAIMDRLDEVCGPANWRNEYRPTANDPSGESITCGISILVQRPDGSAEWVTKWDGAQNTATEPVKGGMSAAMKRAAVQWGIGRYLYDMPTQWVALDERCRTMIEKPKIAAKWLPTGAKTDAEVPHDAAEREEEGRPRDMTPEQRAEIEILIGHPALPKDQVPLWRGWLRKRQSHIMAARAIDRLGQIILENGGLLDEAAIGGDGAAGSLFEQPETVF